RAACRRPAPACGARRRHAKGHEALPIPPSRPPHGRVLLSHLILSGAVGTCRPPRWSPGTVQSPNDNEPPFEGGSSGLATRRLLGRWRRVAPLGRRAVVVAWGRSVVVALRRRSVALGRRLVLHRHLIALRVHALRVGDVVALLDRHVLVGRAIGPRG